MFLPFSRLVMGFDFVKVEEFDDMKVNSWSDGAPFPVSIRSRGGVYEELVREAVEGLE